MYKLCYKNLINKYSNKNQPCYNNKYFTINLNIQQDSKNRHLSHPTY